MHSLNRRIFVKSTATLLLVFVGLVGTAAAATFALWSSIRPAIAIVPLTAGTVVDSQGNTNAIKIVNFGKVVYTGPRNVKSTLNRVRSNNKLSHNNDGTVFGNYSRRLPVKPSGYYFEFVHWPWLTIARPYGMNFPGPMRVILGKGGEVYFTGDHYSTFHHVR